MNGNMAVRPKAKDTAQSQPKLSRTRGPRILPPSNPSKEKRTFAPTRVLVAKLLAVPAVLLDGPDVHLSDRDRREQSGCCTNSASVSPRARRPHRPKERKPHEERTGPVEGQTRERDPGDRLEKVVAARDRVEPVPFRHLADLGAARTERRERQVRLQVGQFGKLCGHGRNCDSDPEGDPQVSSRSARRLNRAELVQHARSRERSSHTATHRSQCATPSRPWPRSKVRTKVLRAKRPTGPSNGPSCRRDTSPVSF